MRVLVCGSREFADFPAVYNRLARYPKGTIVIEGGALGADLLAKVAAKMLDFEVWEFPADWEKHGVAAGPIRNKRMLVEGKPDHVIAFPLPQSRGTYDMIRQAKAAGVTVEVVEYNA